MVGAKGFEPSTPCSQSRCASQAALRPEQNIGGAEGSRTPDLFHAKEARSQLRYSPNKLLSHSTCVHFDCQVAFHKISDGLRASLHPIS